MQIKTYLIFTAWILFSFTLISWTPKPAKIDAPPPPSPPTLSIRPAPTDAPPTATPTAFDVRLPSSQSETLEPVFETPIPTPCPAPGCFLSGHFLLSAPLPANANLALDATYRYGDTQSARRLIHHGIDIKNLLGTPVLAVAEGVVIVAGNDKLTRYGEKEDFYGNLVIIQHDFSEIRKPIFSLYGHLSKVEASVGQRVKTGDKIGRVGMTGVAIGYHLHFEVRVGENRYENTRNPELWLKPLMDSGGKIGGALAGRIINSYGKPMRIAKVVVKSVGALPYETPIYLNTYDDPAFPQRAGGARDDSYLMPYQDEDITLGRDDAWREDFALSNLAPGKYYFSFTSQIVNRRVIEIKTGELTLVNVMTDY
jgi:murein DD-endopeptidase MepM/ murein hydrolase activator NlpD